MEFKIFDENKESYIIGDLLNMPVFFANWNNTPHNNEYMYNLFKKTASQYKDNILGIYDKYRTDENEPIPNIEKIKMSVDTYIELNDTTNYLSLCNDDNVLFVHLRCGDKGVIEESYIDAIVNLSLTYEKIIILTGIHQNAERSHHFPSVSQSINNTKESLSKLYSKCCNITIDVNEPDIHLIIMRKCKNLLLHKGGFSMLGGLLFSGEKLYITDLFYPIANCNIEYFNYVKNYIKI